MKLFFSPFSPFVRKCLVTAHELDLGGAIELLPANAHPVQRDRRLMDSNPLAKVPTLVCDDGSLLYDSRVICEYLNQRAGGTVFPSDPAQRWAALSLQALGDGMMEAAVLARYEASVRPETLRWPEWQAAQLDKADTCLDFLERQPQLLDAQRADIGSIALACALWYLDLRFADFGWRQRAPGVAHWYERFSQRASWRAEWSL